MPILDFAIIMKDDIINAIKDLLDIITSCGMDKVNSKMLKLCAGYISGPLSILFNSFCQQGIFPDTWKQALNTPLYKKGDKYELKNYRPIEPCQ